MIYKKTMMGEPAWIELGHPRYTDVWDRFDAAFEFRPSMRPSEWPSFREPKPSVTFMVADLLREFYPWNDPQATPYNLALLHALTACLAEGESVLALDWQHAGYDFYPHRFHEGSEPSKWRIPSLPSGEYHIFVTEDHRLGSLGHPWEGTVCVFGDEFITEYIRRSPLSRDRIIRRKGAVTL